MEVIMKTLKTLMLTFALVGLIAGSVTAQTANNPEYRTVHKPLRLSFPQFSIAPYGGVIFPLPKVLNQNFKPGANLNIDLGYRANREVGFYAKAGYYIMSSKISGAPIGNYMEISAGPRYYFTKVNVKSELYLEGGVGAYNFKQKSYANPQDLNGSVIDQINNTKTGINGGVGANLALTDAMDFMVKTKYHVIFTPNGTTSFITVGGGLSFRFR
jgi:hypothetical protein